MSRSRPPHAPDDCLMTLTQDGWYRVYVGLEPSTLADRRILRHAARSLRGRLLTTGRPKLNEAVNDSLFEPVRIQLKAAARQTTHYHSRMIHIMHGKAYGEIEFAQYGEEMDISYRLNSEYLSQLSGCGVRVRVGGHEFDLGILDAQGKAGETMLISQVPLECECRFIPAMN